MVATSSQDDWRQDYRKLVLDADSQTIEDIVAMEIRLVWGWIEDVGETPEWRAKRGKAVEPLVDAISVGHYEGVGKPLMAERALDEVVSRKLMGEKYGPDDNIPDMDKLLSLFSERNIVRGTLGQPFFIPDPRSSNGRLIVLAGMGEAGRFGAPELTALARDLCWSLGRLGKKHLATVLIGAGQGNLPTDLAVMGWLRGISYALASSRQDQDWRLQRVTFVESDPNKIEGVQEAILDFKQRSPFVPGEVKLEIDYEPLDFNKVKNKEDRTVYEELQERDRAHWEKKKQEWEEKKRQSKQKRKEGPKPPPDRDYDPVPVRITLSLEGKKFRFGAITQDASIPEREIPLDPTLVMEANQKFPDLESLKEQRDWGRYMENLLIPDDLRPVFSTPAPVVMTLDASTARIHWEMLAQRDIYSLPDNDGRGAEQDGKKPSLDSFLGTSRGFTRQLRTTFAPTSEPPPSTNQLRVLVVADPQEEEHLEEAEREGMEVAELFHSFNTVWDKAKTHIEVVTLFGPEKATRNEVLYHLTGQRYHILHFAGHCFFNEEEPSASGWLFSKGAVLSANELNRIDRIPKFVFSNACESGITPDRASQRPSSLAPSFAEAFFGRGVANFICTAWRVDDTAAREFALEFYSRLLGIERKEDGYEQGTPMPMHRAMYEARRHIAGLDYGIKTWGAYQHYGNPRLRFFDRATLEGSGRTASNADEESEGERQKAAPVAGKERGRKGAGATRGGRRAGRATSPK